MASDQQMVYDYANKVDMLLSSKLPAEDVATQIEDALVRVSFLFS
jgi:hypothetical protein